MARRREQSAAHEAGHVIVSLAVGFPRVCAIKRTLGKHPDSRLQDPDETWWVENTNPGFPDDGRLTYLGPSGGMAGEIVFQGDYDPMGAADDVAHLKEDDRLDVLLDP